MKQDNIKKYIRRAASAAAGTFVLVFVLCFFFRRNFVLTFDRTAVSELTDGERLVLEQKIADARYERNNIVHALPYKTVPARLDLKSESAVLINADTGDILYEKNADECIPPASMTKIFVLYTVFRKMEETGASFDDIVPLSESCWACNMPPHSSLMYLGKDQIVTLGELILGIAVCSGNDASYAAALHLFGSIENCIAEVNREISLLGLSRTKIVEPSGYSSRNVTTAREMAAFARVYISKYPESLELFHSAKKMTYPLQKNLPDYQKGRPAQDFSRGLPEEIWTPFTHENTNKLLSMLDGCDGLKTGYIDESGYNLSLTCRRNGVRCISVTMKGPGKNIYEGNEARISDGRALMEFAFRNFTELSGLGKEVFSRSVPVLGGTEKCVGLVIPYPAETVVPRMTDGNGKNLFEPVRFELNIPEVIFGSVSCGAEYGSAVLKSGDFVIETIPLVAQKDVAERPFLTRQFDRLVYASIPRR